MQPENWVVLGGGGGLALGTLKFFDDTELVIWRYGIGNLANMDLATWQCGLDKWLKWDVEPAFWQSRLRKCTWQNRNHEVGKIAK